MIAIYYESLSSFSAFPRSFILSLFRALFLSISLALAHSSICLPLVNVLVPIYSVYCQYRLPG